MSKICIKCDIEKEINSDNFPKDKKCSDGYRNVCKECCNSRNRELFKIGSLSVDKKKERMRQYMKKKRKDPEFNKSERKKERERNKERRKTDPEYRKKINKKKYERRKKKMENDPVYRFKIKIRKRIRSILKDRGYTKKSKTHEILSISYEEFNLHMERQFVKGMTWDNYGEWHIDHIIPLATAICEDDVIRLNHYTNLQPLWAEDNIRKGSKIL
jgi:hypothetical protein